MRTLLTPLAAALYFLGTGLGWADDLSFRSGQWTGHVNFEKTGCVMLSPFSDGASSLVVEMVDQSDVSIGIYWHKERFDNWVDQPINGRIIIDRQPPLDVAGTFVRNDYLRLASSSKGLLMHLFTAGSQARLEYSDDAWATFGLRGTSKAVDKLHQCWLRHQETGPVASGQIKPLAPVASGIAVQADNTFIYKGWTGTLDPSDKTCIAQSNAGELDFSIAADVGAEKGLRGNDVIVGVLARGWKVPDQIELSGQVTIDKLPPIEIKGSTRFDSNTQIGQAVMRNASFGLLLESMKGGSQMRVELEGGTWLNVPLDGVDEVLAKLVECSEQASGQPDSTAQGGISAVPAPGNGAEPSKSLSGGGSSQLAMATAYDIIAKNNHCFGEWGDLWKFMSAAEPGVAKSLREAWDGSAGEQQQLIERSNEAEMKKFMAAAAPEDAPEQFILKKHTSPYCYQMWLLAGNGVYAADIHTGPAAELAVIPYDEEGGFGPDFLWSAGDSAAN